MIAYLPIPGGHIKLAERFVDPALSFTMGWNYWYNWTILVPAELVASAVLMSYWKSVSSVCLIDHQSHVLNNSPVHSARRSKSRSLDYHVLGCRSLHQLDWCRCVSEINSDT